MSSQVGDVYPEISSADPSLAAILQAEIGRQTTTLQLIASENFTSRAVLEASGSILTNKYAEGYPSKRYYGGNQFIDQVEDLARARLKAIYNAEHANVQPHAGANANAAAYLAILKPGDAVLAMRLDQGGHLTHGSPVNFSGQFYRFIAYGVTPADGDVGERIDFDQMASLAKAERPKLIVVGATAYPRMIDVAPVRAIADEIGALVMFDSAHVAGLIAAGVYPNPLGSSESGPNKGADVMTFTTHKTLRGPRGGAIVCTSQYAQAIDKAVFPGLQGGPLEHAIAAKAVAFKEAQQPDFVTYQEQVLKNAKALASALELQGFRAVSGGTDTHLILVDLMRFDPNLSGKEAQESLDRAGITCNRNQIPYDTRSPFVTSGLRFGTPAMTTTGMKEAEMEHVASLIGQALRKRDSEEALASIRSEVAELCAKFPPPPFN
ncbi:MAG: serine hydroxymethyltransferase [Actinomycetota bacterium]|nr:serine hydroxymethyltransferase [Actinomycetota bacterium]